VTHEELGLLRAQALRVREEVVRMTGRGGCFLGASLSCTDLLVHLYGRVLRVDPLRPDDPERDYLFLSKGHDVPALYACLVERGFLGRERLLEHLQVGSDIYWHPSRAIPGVEFHSGSLGHLLSVALGVALDVRLRGGLGRAFVVLGDGELNEGSVWEAALVAGAHGLDNLTVVVDRNGFQANGRTEDLIPLEPLLTKFESFGWSARSADGHCFEALEDAFTALPLRPGRPTAILARTVRGRGLASLEDSVERWFVELRPEEVERLVEELHGGARARLDSAPRLVR
jgi:transketolase